jgi:hypothetical protein
MRSLPLRHTLVGVAPVRRLAPYLLLAFLVLGIGLGTGLGLSEAPTFRGAHRIVPPGRLTTTLAQSPQAPTTFPAVPLPTVPVVTTGVSIILRGDGLGAAIFGQSATVAIGELEPLLGYPTGLTNMAGNCTIDAMVSWQRFNAYFLQGHFVGFSTGSLLGESGANAIPNAMTVNGLRVGDTLGHAENLYQGAIQTSYSQGGSWYVRTPTGELAGLLTLELTPQTRIAYISGGSVGCPAASP